MKEIDIRQEKRFTDYQSKKADMLKADIPIKNKLLIRKTLRPLLRCMLRMQRKFNHFHVELLNEIKDTDKAVIYAVTHIGKWDFEIINEQIAKPFYILAADFININKGFNGLFMKLNGVVYVNEKSNIDRHNTKKIMIRLLKAGNSMMIFPEGTWNLSENELIYDIPYGTASISIETNTPIIPIAIEQYGNRFVINTGEKIMPDNSIPELTQKIRDILASLKWEIWYKQGICKRNELDDDYWNGFVQQRVMEWAGYSMDEQIINTFVPKEKRTHLELCEKLGFDKIPLRYRNIQFNKLFKEKYNDERK